MRWMRRTMCSAEIAAVEAIGALWHVQKPCSQLGPTKSRSQFHLRNSRCERILHSASRSSQPGDCRKEIEHSESLRPGVGHRICIRLLRMLVYAVGSE